MPGRQEIVSFTQTHYALLMLLVGLAFGLVITMAVIVEAYMARPKRTPKDENHPAVKSGLTMAGLRFIDTADLPGDPLNNPLDGLVIDPKRQPIPVIVACSAAGVMRWLDEHPDQPMVLVEIKANPAAPFTPNEEAFLRSLGLWPPDIYV